MIERLPEITLPDLVLFTVHAFVDGIDSYVILC